MPLPAGTRIGPYEIIAPLGQGGMGEVYRATDIHLGRAAAIKVLPETFALDAERIARFEREARTLASLNHPNIAQVFGLVKGEGGLALAMELVEGQTLGERLERGRFRSTTPLRLHARWRRRSRSRTIKASSTAI
jgi:serine/threonine protein kinase